MQNHGIWAAIQRPGDFALNKQRPSKTLLFSQVWRGGWLQRENIFVFYPELSITFAATSCQVVVISHLGHCSHLHTSLPDSTLVPSASNSLFTLCLEWHFQSINLAMVCLCLKFFRPPVTKAKLLNTRGHSCVWLSFISHPRLPPTFSPPHLHVPCIYQNQPCKCPYWCLSVSLSSCLSAWNNLQLASGVKGLKSSHLWDFCSVFCPTF